MLRHELKKPASVLIISDSKFHDNSAKLQVSYAISKQKVMPKEQISVRLRAIYLQTGKVGTAHLAQRNLPSDSIAVKIRYG